MSLYDAWTFIRSLKYGSLYIYLRLELCLRHFYVRSGVPGFVFEVSFVWLCCFVARAPGSLAGGFLVAVAGRALFVVAFVLDLRDFFCDGPVWMFHLFTCTMGSAAIKWTCTVEYS